MYDVSLNSCAAELRQCVGLVELSLEHNKLIRPLLDFRSLWQIADISIFPFLEFSR